MPDQPRIVIVNTTPLIALTAIRSHGLYLGDAVMREALLVAGESHAGKAKPRTTKD